MIQVNSKIKQFSVPLWPCLVGGYQLAPRFHNIPSTVNSNKIHAIFQKGMSRHTSILVDVACLHFYFWHLSFLIDSGILQANYLTTRDDLLILIGTPVHYRSHFLNNFSSSLSGVFIFGTPIFFDQTPSILIIS